jgi:hypothetical protein
MQMELITPEGMPIPQASESVYHAMRILGVPRHVVDHPNSVDAGSGGSFRVTYTMTLTHESKRGVENGLHRLEEAGSMVLTHR